MLTAFLPTASSYSGFPQPKHFTQIPETLPKNVKLVIVEHFLYQSHFKNPIDFENLDIVEKLL